MIDDDVILLSLGQGMEEAGRTKSDAKGNFTFKLDAEGPHLVRVIHQEVTYHRMAPPGTTSVEVEVFDRTPADRAVERAAGSAIVLTNKTPLPAAALDLGIVLATASVITAAGPLLVFAYVMGAIGIVLEVGSLVAPALFVF